MQFERMERVFQCAERLLCGLSRMAVRPHFLDRRLLVGDVPKLPATELVRLRKVTLGGFNEGSVGLPKSWLCAVQSGPVCDIGCTAPIV